MFSIIYLVLSLVPVMGSVCRCPLEATHLCQMDFCGQFIVGSQTNGSYSVHVIRQFTGSPLPSLLSNNKECPLALRKGQTVYLCGEINEGQPMVSACHFSKTSLSVSELSFFTSGFQKCLLSRRLPFKKPPFRAPPSSPVAVDMPIASSPTPPRATR